MASDAAYRKWREQVSSSLGSHLLQGWTMLATSCEVCNTVMMRDRQGTEKCIGCTDCKYEPPEASDPVTTTTTTTINTEPAPAPEPAPEPEPEPEPEPTPDQLAAQRRREWRDEVSEKLGTHLLQGWTMLASHCELCQTVMMRDRRRNEVCIGCECAPEPAPVPVPEPAPEPTDPPIEQLRLDRVAQAASQLQQVAMTIVQQVAMTIVPDDLEPVPQRPPAQPAHPAAYAHAPPPVAPVGTTADEAAAAAMVTSQLRYATQSAAQALGGKMQAASELLTLAAGTQETIELIQVISQCAMALQNLQPLL